MENLQESSLSRIKKHTEEHDTGTITAFRYARDCGKGEKYTKDENLKRNKSLLAKLQAKRYGVTSIKGSYIENYGTDTAREVGENVFFVVDLNDTGELLKDLKKLGLEFDQDSILYIPKGGERSELHGTNHCENGFPGFGKIKKYSQRVLGDTGKFFSRVNGRPFVFNESDQIEKEYYLPQGFFGRWGCDSIAKTHWSELEL